MRIAGIPAAVRDHRRRAGTSASAWCSAGSREIAVPLQLGRHCRWACGAPSTAGSSRRAAQIAAGAPNVAGSAAAARGVRGAAGAGGRGDRPHDQRRDARFQPGAAAAVGGDRRRVGARHLRVPQAARSGGGQRQAAPLALPEPGTVDYARSFFPVAFIVLIVRAFIFEPFRIPSDSMMPTLLDGDFIVVNKYAYGLRWPVLNEKFLDIGTPQRGDVVVFRYPPDPSINYIKRLVGLPGDRVEVRDDQLVINGETDRARGRRAASPTVVTSACRLSTETLGEHTHQVMSCRSPDGLSARRSFAIRAIRIRCRPATARRCARTSAAGSADESPPGRRARQRRLRFRGGAAGHYLMIGDNRDNSEDSRAWGLVPDENLVGKATRIWFNFDLQRSGRGQLGAASAMASNDRHSGGTYAQTTWCDDDRLDFPADPGGDRAVRRHPRRPGVPELLQGRHGAWRRRRRSSRATKP